MNDALKLISTFVDAVSLVMALILMVSLVHRNDLQGLGRSALLGATFSLAIVFSMSDPIDLGENGFFDMRGLLVGTAVALMGPTVGLVAAATAITYRLVIGGPGVASGMALIGGAFAGGVLWRYTIRRRSMETWKKSVLLGLFISAQSAGIFFAPAQMQYTILTGLVPYIVMSNIVGALVINHLLSGELSFLSQAEASKIEANTDHLTGLLNRRGLDMIYPDLVQSEDDTPGRALLYFDIDRFKVINDTHGHAVGDAVLKSITQKIARNLRPQDVFARLGGDEFAIVLSEIDASEAQRIAERCRDVVSSGGFKLDAEVLALSISIGAIWMLDHTEIDEILDEADRALYSAKEGGRDRVVFESRLAAPMGRHAAPA